MRVAAIDIGTVTSRLYIADVTSEGISPIVRRSVITNLGLGVDATGVLMQESIDRTVAQVAEYKREIDAVGGVDRLVALATSASRDAENSADFVGKLGELGVTLTVIPGEREAALAFLGAANEFRGEDVLVVDSGGGSTEVIFGRAEAEGGLVPETRIYARHSFNIGCRRITERFLHSDPPSPEEMDAARAWAKEGMADFFAQGLPCQRVIAVAGTATSVVSVRDEMVPYDSSRVHKATVTRADLDDVASRLCALPLEERRKMPGLQPQRAAVMPAGVGVLQVVMDLAGVDSMTISESDLLQGIVLDAARA
ncbi:Guanosine-5'-triphosphate,3'-diphosphate pyrophosphatase [Slackia heliotrinireducens]|uniref:Exopolyphosphatase n=1 Tax=Slackia heliotrinireducens (strain ATCC 29202 / DSM 20476 / NCTC 11029 / RHS 1) TaxID=471855 RepID=C7N7U3_SLAHD|nr:Ppx/GppA phosphatase family protein [Slackia heliotrinireducens]ACV22978.1 exopolyphosphatase [Slackia heliotrinireducens DSM 20476]VEH01849.1 Guanosine-5'-triphosphate,3'-diphosphate pyrophosphatase [Slackia heliotrinireducens]